MKKIIFIASIFLITVLSASCDGERDSQSNSIIVYGRTTCGNTNYVRNTLNSEGIGYTFSDIDISSNSSAMWQDVYSSDWYSGGSVALPIVNVNGTVLEFPTLSEIESCLN